MVIDVLERSFYPLYLHSNEFKRFVQFQKFIRDTKKGVTLKDFKRIALLGKGAFGRVVAVMKKDSKSLFAMKEIPKVLLRRKRSCWMVKNEKAALSKMRSPFVLGLNYAFQSRGGVHLVFEMCTGGNLRQYLEKEGPLRLAHAQFYTAEVLLGLEHIHSQGYIYRDLKPSNVLLTEAGHCKIADLGLVIEQSEACAVAASDQRRLEAGTPGYWSPEVMSGGVQRCASDFWSLGVLAYNMLFAKDRVARKDTAHKHVVATVEIPEGVDEKAKDFLLRLLTVDQAKRMGAKGAEEIKSHSFLNRVSWGKLAQLEIAPPFTPKEEPLTLVSDFTCRKFPPVLRETMKERETFAACRFKNEYERVEEIVNALRYEKTRSKCVEEIENTYGDEKITSTKAKRRVYPKLRILHLDNRVLRKNTAFYH
eukprot:jgi/Bigna1/55939/estExt_Genewise1Plus.C_760020